MDVMSDGQFWDLIERSRSGAKNCDEQAEKLAALLDKMPTPEVMAFWRLWWDKMGVLDSRDVHNVACIINGGCSDDAFTDFRGWVIARGREFFLEAVEKPERIAEGVPEGAEGGDVGCEAIVYCASEIYFERTGHAPFEDDEDDTDGRSQSSDGRHLNERWPNEPWSEDDLPRLYPELCARFWGESA